MIEDSFIEYEEIEKEKTEDGYISKFRFWRKGMDKTVLSCGVFTSNELRDDAKVFKIWIIKQLENILIGFEKGEIK